MKRTLSKKGWDSAAADLAWLLDKGANFDEPISIADEGTSTTSD